MNLIDPTNTELYSLVLHDAPYVIAAYGILWLSLCGYVTFVLTRIMKMDKEIMLLEDAIAKKK
jgi:CcmD family protein